MKRFSLKLIVAAVYLATTLSQAFANSVISDEVAKSMLEKMGPGSRIDTLEVKRNGIVTHIVQVRNCSGDGLSCHTNSYRTTRTPVSLDSKSMVIETVDRKISRGEAQSYDRLNFKVSPLSGAAPKTGPGPIAPPVDVSHSLYLDMGSQSDFFKELKVVAPAVGSGLLNSYHDMQASAQVAAQLQHAYSKTMEAYGKASDHLVEGAVKTTDLSHQASQQFQVLAAAAIALPVQSVNTSPEYRNYVKAALDPFSFREYELTEPTKAQFKADLKVALQRRDAAKVVELGKTLLQQKDPQAREAAQRELQPVFRDGIVRTQALGAGAPSVVDGASYKTQQHSASGQIVRQLANKAQVDWIRSKGMTELTPGKSAAYTSALVALQAADESFTQGRAGEGLYLSEVTNTLLDFANGFVDGGVAGVSEALHAIPELASAVNEFTQLLVVDPHAAAEKFAGVIAAVPGVAEAVAVRYLTLADQLKNGSAAERGKALGTLGSEALMAWMTGGTGAAAKAGTAAATAIKASRAGQMATGLGKAAVTSATEMGKRIGVDTARTVVRVAKTDTVLAANVLRAANKLADVGDGAKKQYLDFVATQSARMSEGVKSTAAVTNAIQNKVIKSAEQLTQAKSLAKALDTAPHQLELRQVGSNGKVAVIGRSMDTNVRPVARHLEQNGFQAETLKLSQAAQDDWDKLLEKYPGGIPIEAQRAGVGYAENQRWVQKLIDEDYTVVDARNPNNLGSSIYYDELELGMLTKGKK